jgi:hypothetical protein
LAWCLAFRRRETVFVPAAHEEDRQFDLERVHHSELRSVLTVPLVVKSQEMASSSRFHPIHCGGSPRPMHRRLCDVVLQTSVDAIQPRPIALEDVSQQSRARTLQPPAALPGRKIRFDYEGELAYSDLHRTRADAQHEASQKRQEMLARLVVA